MNNKSVKQIEKNFHQEEKPRGLAVIFDRETPPLPSGFFPLRFMEREIIAQIKRSGLPPPSPPCFESHKAKQREEGGGGYNFVGPKRSRPIWPETPGQPGQFRNPVRFVDHTDPHVATGCRTDASEAAIILLPSNITVFTLDFSGSGLSGGEHVTLGWNEKDDLKAVVDYLRADGNVSLIGLWGRSMGAVTSLMYGAEDPSIAGMVLDSPFSDLVDLMMELVDTYKVRLPKFTVKFAIQYMRRAIQKKAKFDITDLNAIKVAKSCFVPVLFGHAIDDDFIQPHHSDRIFDAYVGSWSTVHDMDYSDDLLGSPAGPATSSTEDAIKMLRSRRPMSMIVVPADISSNDRQPDAQVEGRGSDSQASSSNMISFELSGAGPHGSHMPVSINDDEYVEYPLDTLADFPCNLEEEERATVLESLKDLNVKKPPVDEPSSNGGGDLEPKPAPKNGPNDSFSTQSNSLNPELVSTSAADDHKSAPEMLLPNPDKEMQGTCIPNDTSTCNQNVPVANSKETNDAAPHHIGEETSETMTSHGNTTLANQTSSSEVDMADRTKVTVKVVKNPTSNIMDGLLRRWDLNFFRNR
ncbi:hypothetical protein DH2020_020004 [Rehmannia glutinosa]|uniref:Serine aminopeptidase S33 domain-containing protein n=1 Tax=Rehmannia glutinosa TaxID=99300 RepID=A0ABR0WG59_REHGL